MIGAVERRTEKLDFRITKAAKKKLQAAALASHRGVTDFVIESALARAEETLASRTNFGLDDAAWKAFQKILDAPARDLRRMSALLNDPGFFER